MKEKRDWKYIGICILSLMIVTVSYWVIFDISQISAVCFTAVAIMLPMGYVLFKKHGVIV